MDQCSCCVSPVSSSVSSQQWGGYSWLNLLLAAFRQSTHMLLCRKHNKTRHFVDIFSSHYKSRKCTRTCRALERTVWKLESAPQFVICVLGHSSVVSLEPGYCMKNKCIILTPQWATSIRAHKLTPFISRLCKQAHQIHQLVFLACLLDIFWDLVRAPLQNDHSVSQVFARKTDRESRRRSVYLWPRTFVCVFLCGSCEYLHAISSWL